jgi:pSer/pThr/pTyr-binding forkhead associated (FHA) protein
MGSKARGTSSKTMVSARRHRLRHANKDIDLVGNALVVGRDADCDFILDRDLVSRHHARFIETDEGLVVEDLGSRNGVFVNERRIREPTLLGHGDVVSIGLEAFEIINNEVAPRRKKETLPMTFEPDSDGDEPVTVTARLDVLSAREREIFELFVLGHTQREIGERLHVSVKTVEAHRAHIADKLHCRTRAELVAYAITAGLLHKPTR